MIRSLKDEVRAKFSVWDNLYPPDQVLPPVEAANLSEVVVNEFSYAPLSNEPGPFRRYRIFWNVSGPTDKPWTLNLFNTEGEQFNNPLPLIGETETQPVDSGRYVLKANSGNRERILGTFDIQQELQACIIDNTGDFLAYLYWFFDRYKLNTYVPKTYYDGDFMDNLEVHITPDDVQVRIKLRYRTSYSLDPHMTVNCHFGFRVADNTLMPGIKRANIVVKSLYVDAYFTGWQDLLPPFTEEAWLSEAKETGAAAMRIVLGILERSNEVQGFPPMGNTLYTIGINTNNGGTLRKLFCPIPVPSPIAWDKVIKNKVKAKLYK